MMNKTLVVGDTHTEPGEDLFRFKALSFFIVDKRPDNIVLIGDHLTLDSLSTYDLTRPGKIEGRRLKVELDTGRRAITLIESEILKLQEKQRKQKKKVYTPRKVFCTGNHEDRFNRYLDHHPELKEVIDLDEKIGLIKHGWEVIPYREYAYIGDTSFTHIPMNGLNKPLSGVQLHVNAAKGHNEHIVYGHTHALTLTSISRTGKDDQQIFALNCGCFFHGVPDYAKGSSASRNWWRGVILLTHGKGMFDVDTYSMDSMLKAYRK